MKNVSELISEYYRKNPDGHYFDRDTLKFFGERVSDMYLHKSIVRVTDSSGQERQAYQISRLQRKHPGGPRRTYAYFDVDTLDDIIV